MTEDKVKSINGCVPNPHSDYKKFSYKDKDFYPFSVDLTRFNLKTDKGTIKEIINELYCHIDWR